MKIIQFVHPVFLSSQSMPRFAQMITDGMRARGHEIEDWSPISFFYKLPFPKRFKKWLGYVDQYIIFPIQVRWKLRNIPIDTLFVFADQALGPWVKLVKYRPNVIHVHDFMALRSSLGDFPQNPTGWSGMHYQSFIRRGFNCGQNFISVSENTKNDLHHFLNHTPVISAVVYNGLNYPFRPLIKSESKFLLSNIGFDLPIGGFLIHVGGNQWYKNRLGVLEIYKSYVEQTINPLPLWMVGAPPTVEMELFVIGIPEKGAVLFLSGLSNEQVCAAYSNARLLIFPSFAEGFGWPIAEAMACGCLVLTTDQAPMTEVGGSAVFLIPCKSDLATNNWATFAVNQINEIISLPTDEIIKRKSLGLIQASLFETQKTLDSYENVYKKIINLYFHHSNGVSDNQLS